MKEVFALIYAKYDEFYLLEMGDRDFIFEKYNEKISQRKDFEEKFKHLWDEKLKIYDVPDNDQEYDNMVRHPGNSIDDIDHLCIQGYDEDGKIKCVCKDFGIKKDRIIFLY